MISIKTPKDLELMIEGGKIARKAIDMAIEAVKPGVTGLDINSIAKDYILQSGAVPSFKGYEGFTHAVCVNINSGVVHGIPNNQKFKPGDVVSVDLGVLLNGYHTDVSESVEVETLSHKKFLDTGREALKEAIFMCRPGNRVGDISNSIQNVIEREGYSVSRDLAGHGVGRELHEDPFIPCYGKKGKGEKLAVGMVLAIEVIYQVGDYPLVIGNDGWTLSTRDGSLSGLFEKTVAVTTGDALVLT